MCGESEGTEALRAQRGAPVQEREAHACPKHRGEGGPPFMKMLSMASQLLFKVKILMY